MAIISSWDYANDGSFSNSMAGGERIWHSNSNSAVTALDVGEWPLYTLVGNSGGTTVTALANNCQYVSATEVSLNGAAAVTLDAANVAQNDATMRIAWQDDAANTALSNMKLFVYKPTDPNDPPDNITVVAFERTSSAIRKSHDEGAGDGDAWNGAEGIGGLGNALDMADRASAATHNMYVGFSCSASAYGSHTNMIIRISFDVA